MSRHNFTWEGDGYDPEGDPYDRYSLWGKRRQKDGGVPPCKRVVADLCWCGTRKHVEWPVCSTCRVILEKDAAK